MPTFIVAFSGTFPPKLLKISSKRYYPTPDEARLMPNNA